VWYVLALVLIGGCALIHGPCSVRRSEVACGRDGRALVVAPGVTINAVGEAAAQSTPRLEIPPQMRN